MSSLRRLRLALRVALLAMWMAALAPTLSAALGSAGGLEFAEVCSATVSPWTGLADPDGKTPGGAAVADSCGYCLLSAHLAPAPAWQLPAALKVQAGPVRPVLVSLGGVAPAWAHQPSRAPPSLG